MDEINPLILQNEMNLWLKKLKNGRKNKGIISNIFKFAIRNGYVQYNPTESVTTATRRRDENFSDFYNKEELK